MGVYLVFASLIIPALATIHYKGIIRILTGYGIAAGACFIGLLASTLFDLPSGPAIICAYSFIGATVFFVERSQEKTYRH